MNHRNRSASWLWAVAIFAVYFQEHGQGLVMWVAMGLQFLVYPHVVFWRARLAADPLQAEIQNMLLDTFCFGVWAALLGFPLWISGLLVICGCMNMAAFRGGVGVGQALVATAAGAVLVALLGAAAPFAPDTSLTVSLMCLGALGAYLGLFARSTYRRTVVLNDTRVKLRQSEQALQGQLDAVQSLQAQLTEQANRDPLTGLYNRRYLNDSLQREFDRCARDGSPVSLLLIDLDHFKQINDQHGHTVGDEVLRALARIVLSNVRATDCAGRYGGDEFAIVLRGMHLDGATAVAHRIREQVQALQLHDMPGLQFTTSMGVATADHRHSSLRAWTNAADAELYQAKAAGRNRVSASSMPDMAPVV